MNTINATSTEELYTGPHFDLARVEAIAKSHGLELINADGSGSRANPCWQITLHTESGLVNVEIDDSDANENKSWHVFADADHVGEMPSADKARDFGKSIVLAADIADEINVLVVPA